MYSSLWQNSTERSQRDSFWSIYSWFSYCFKLSFNRLFGVRIACKVPMTEHRCLWTTSSLLQPFCDLDSFCSYGYGPHWSTGFCCSSIGLAKTSAGLRLCSPQFLIDALPLWSLAGHSVFSAWSSCQNLVCRFPGSDFSFPNNAVRLAGAPDPIHRNSSCKTVNFIVFSSKLLTA